MIEVTLLGTGTPLPDPHRAGPATLVRAGSKTFLVDAGRGVVMRAAAAGSGANQLTAVLLTHLHSDHITDLGDLVTTRWITTFEPSPLIVVGPPGTKGVAAGVLQSLSADIGYRTTHHADLDVPAPTPGTEDEWRAIAAPLFAGRVELGDDLHRVVVPTNTPRGD